MTDTTSATDANLNKGNFREYFTAMAYDAFKLEHSPSETAFSHWYNNTKARAETLAHASIHDVVAEAQQASQLWAELESPLFHAQRHQIASILQEDSDFLALLDSYDRQYPLSYAQASLAALELVEKSLELARPTTVSGSAVSETRVHLFHSAGYAQLSQLLRDVIGSLAQGNAVILLGKQQSLLRLAELWQKHQLPKGLLHILYQDNLHDVAQHKDIAIVSGVRPSDAVPQRASLQVLPPLPAHDTVILTNHADIASALHTIVARCLGLQRPCELWVQEAVMDKVKDRLESILSRAQQGHPWDSNATSCHAITPEATQHIRDHGTLIYQNEISVLGEIYGEFPAQLQGTIKRGEVKEGEIKQGAVLGLRSFRRLQDIPTTIAPVLSLWTESLHETQELRHHLSYRHLFLNHVGDVPYDYQPLPAAFNTGNPLRSSFNEATSNDTNTPQPIAAKPAPTWQARAQLFYQLATHYPHHSAILQSYAAQMHTCAERQAYGKVVFIFPASINEASLAQLAFAVVAAGNQLSLLSQEAGLDKAKKLCTLTNRKLPLQVCAMSGQQTMQRMLKQADYVVYMGDSEGADIIAEQLEFTQPACYITHALPENFTQEVQTKLLRTFSHTRTI